MLFRWNEVETSRFVELYKNCPCLWNAGLEAYKERDARIAAYRTIIHRMGIPELTVYDVKNKIKNLRSQYHQLCKKIHVEAESGRIYRPRLAWFDHFKSVMGEGEAEKMECAKVEEEEEEEEETAQRNAECDSEPQSPSRNDLPDRMVAFPEPSRKRQKPPLIHTLGRIKCRRVNVEYTQRRDQSNALNRAREDQKDEFQMFADGIATQLKKLPLVKALRLQIEIQTLVANERINCLSEEQ